jgi:hypothetical protein
MGFAEISTLATSVKPIVTNACKAAFNYSLL